MHETQQPTPEELEATPPPRGILLTGEGLARLTPERLQMLAELLGGLGLKMTGTDDIEALLNPPIPASKDDFVRFAREQKLTDRIAISAWNVVERTAYFNELPEVALRFAIKGGKRYVDLRSVQARLTFTQSWPRDWRAGSEAPIIFLRSMVEAEIGFDVPPPSPKPPNQ